MMHLPKNIAAEQWVLGGMMLDNAVIDDVAMVVEPDDFYTDEHQTICKAIFNLRNEGKPATPVTLMDLLASLSRDKHQIEMLESIMGSVAHGLDAAYHARIIREKSIKRKLILACENITRLCYADQKTALELTEEAEKQVFEIAERETESESVPIRVAVDEAIARMERRHQNQDHGAEVTTGLVSLDEMTDGFQPGQLVVVAARPSVGKTAFAINICEHVAIDSNKCVQIFSLEMDRKEIGDRIISGRGKIDGYKIRTCNELTPRDWQEMRKIQRLVDTSPLEIDHCAMRTIGQISAILRRRVRQMNCVLGVIDYIQLIDPQASKGESRQEQVARISRRLKVLAKHLGIPIIILAQLNRESEKREDKRPRMADLRESGAIEQDADLVLLLHRPDLYDPNDDPKDKSARDAELIVAKNRSGPTGTVKLKFFKQFTRFCNPEDIPPPLSDF